MHLLVQFLEHDKEGRNHEDIYKNQNFDDVFDATVEALDPQNRSFVRMLVTTTLRRKGQIDNTLKHFLIKKLPQNAMDIYDVLCLSACQILFMETPDFAAVDTAVEMTRHLKKNAFSKLVNGVLRNLCRQKEQFMQQRNDYRLNTPDWLWNSWVEAYGESITKKIAQANLTEPATYITCKNNAPTWAEKLNGTLLLTNSIRLPSNSYIPNLVGFAEGAWWVQDAAAALAVQVFDDVKDKKVADLCAAPGGKTAALIARGAKVDAFDISAKRMQRVKENLDRLKYSANLYVKDANEIEEQEIYDAILLDAPCSATGTIMRHPDIYFHRTPEDIVKLNKAQNCLLKTAYRLLKKDGQLVYCTCSLQKQEGEDIIDKVSDLFERQTINNPLLKQFVTKQGDIRTFPYQKMDGFFISLLKKHCK